MSRKITERANGSKLRPTVRLGAEVEKKLSAYAATALAAGVGLMVVAEPAEAKIVYTPAKVRIVPNGPPVHIDLSHDGITDFTVSNIFRTNSGRSFASLLVGDAGKVENQVWGRGTASQYGRGRYASALFKGISVGPNKLQLHKSPTALMAGLLVSFFPEARRQDRAGLFSSTCSNASFGCDSSTRGQWLYTKHRYLGLRFEIRGKLHYGWARFEVSRIPMERDHNTISATLTGYAYETEANTPIITGKTKGPDVVTMPEDVGERSLGALAAGRAVTAPWRGNARLH